MKQKCWVVLMACVVLLLGAPLTADAETSDASPLIQPDDLTWLDDWGDLEEYGFANGLMVNAALYTGVFNPDEETDPDNFQVVSAELEPDQFYTMYVDFFIVVDSQNLDRYEDCNLQVRLPATLLPDSPNAIGYGVNGDGIDTWADIFGLSSSETLDLCYVAETCEFDFFLCDKGRKITDVAESALFSSATGLPIGNCFETALEETMPIGNYEIAYMTLKFQFYTSPHQGTIAPEYIALNYWAGQKLLQNQPITPAPKSFCLAMQKDDIEAMELSQSQKLSDHTAKRRIVIVSAVILVGVILAIVIVARIHKDKFRRIMDRFLYYLAQNDNEDDDDDYLDDFDDSDDQ